MKFRFECPACKTAIKSDSENFGRRGKCPECGAIFYIPSPPSVTAQNQPKDFREEDKVNEAVIKELSHADVFYDNLCKTDGWRFGDITKQARYCRDSLDKAFALNGHTGHWLIDLWVHLVNGLPWFLPVTGLIPSVLGSLICTVTYILSYSTMEQKVVDTVKTVPYWYFFNTTTTEKVVVMEPVRHAPNPLIVYVIVAVILITVSVAFSYITKAVLKCEMQYRRRLLLKYIARKNS
jgi:hypothetical protein